MRKIGYIFKYSADEHKGILVYGQWCNQRKLEFSYQHIKLKDKPVIFTSSDCLCEVKTGDLVYFNLDNGKVSDINRASLSNFDKVLLTTYAQNNIIKFEQIYDKDSMLIKEGILAVLDKYSSTKDYYKEVEETNAKNYEYYDLQNNKFIKRKVRIFDYSFPKNIDEIYSCFGKYGHERRYDSILKKRKIRWPRRDNDNSVVVNIFDLSLWIDEDIISQQDYYGKCVEEIQVLYDLFVQTIKINNTGKNQHSKEENAIISHLWAFLLVQFSWNDLRQIITLCPKLQPALPVEFCKYNLDVLDDKYGMPNIDICKDFGTHKVRHASTATEYKDWSHKLYVFANCNSKHLPGEGVPMCSMDKEFIAELKAILDRQYIDFIEFNMINRINDFLQSSSSDSINELSKEELLDVGVFVDILYTFKPYLSQYGVYLWDLRFEKIVKLYNSLDIKLQKILYKGWCKYVNDSLLEVSRTDDISPLSLGLTVELIKDYLTDNTKSEIIGNVNDRFARVSDFSDLHYALVYGYISEEQFSAAIKRLTESFTMIQFARFITNSRSETGSLRFIDMPVELQRYVLNHFVEKYDAKDLKKGERVIISEFNGFYNLGDFIRWLTELKSGQYGDINQDAVEVAIEKAVEPLNKHEIKYLFDKKYLVKPGETVETLYQKYVQNYYEQLTKDIEYQNSRDSLYDEVYDSQYSGSRANEEGYSDDDIDTIFDGDPDAYWNIDKLNMNYYAGK